MIPGNHDWYSGGLKGLLRQEKYITKKAGKDIFKPSKGCPLESISVNNQVQLIILDTQWYLENWNKNLKLMITVTLKQERNFLKNLRVY